ncbi:MAG: hypothetical protein GX062_00750, partial [Firmicutes bacterium]|nr:hypothetical protein [Bacillota bacterium]
AKAVHPIFPGLVLSIIIIFALTMVTEPASPETIKRFFPRAKIKEA